MSRKIVTGGTLVLTLCFLILGFMFKYAADKQLGVGVSTGIVVEGEYMETESGRIGVNREKYEAFYTGGTIFYALAGVTDIICVASAIRRKRSNRNS